MAVDFNDRRFRSDFKPERDRIMKAIRDCEELDKTLSEMIKNLREGMARNRGAASAMIRMTEQQISNRNQRLSLIKELRSLKKDVLERDIKLAEKSDPANQGASGVTAELLKRLQIILLAPGATTSTLEPVEADADAAIAARLGEDIEEPAAPDLSQEAVADVEDEDNPEIPDEVREGDIVSDTDGELWLVGEDGIVKFQEDGVVVEDLFLETENDRPAYARLSDGRYVLVVELD